MDKTEANKLKAIKSHPLFKELSDEETEILARFTKERVFSQDTEFIRQGEKADDVFFIQSGGARVYVVTEEGREVTLALLGPGDLIGEMAFLNNEPRSACVRTLQETHLFMLGSGDFRNILTSNPGTALNLLKVLANRVRIADEKIEDFQSKNLYERTWKSLQSLANYFTGREIPLSQEDLAAILGATRPRVSEVLATMKEQGKVSYTRKKIRLI